ncbi:hypothetical protein GGS23DRAFT_169924 [Durotheca rogersii]|uniref:uncharacterized protein n=1 Tax=Durotheca rogersii TaxID=419775 RepID=UPI00221EDFD5|nr:uncharacterized protein GGS23DRAFT_169924 [Durotheca rogersii]KAI5867305.1 hypothetical protein GGS23DRAFT_169924 [Durotheca rogersii]
MPAIALESSRVHDAPRLAPTNQPSRPSVMQVAPPHGTGRPGDRGGRRRRRRGNVGSWKAEIRKETKKKGNRTSGRRGTWDGFGQLTHLALSELHERALHRVCRSVIPKCVWQGVDPPTSTTSPTTDAHRKPKPNPPSPLGNLLLFLLRPTPPRPSSSQLIKEPSYPSCIFRDDLLPLVKTATTEIGNNISLGHDPIPGSPARRRIPSPSARSLYTSTYTHPALLSCQRSSVYTPYLLTYTHYPHPRH